jgi:predicted RNase H-like HicB family nuclease
MKWRVILERDESTGEWSVWCPELPGCTGAGETEWQALENIREAMELYLEP